MNIQLGIYELFSTIIPGSVYLVAVGQVLIMTGVVPFSWKTINSLSFVSAIIFLVASYLLGIAFSRFALWWYKIFKGKDQSTESLKRFKVTHQDRWNINVEDEDWHILLALIRSRNFDLALENERHLASSIMLRNVSFGFLLLAVINFIQYFIVWNLFFLAVGFGFLVLSILTIGESMKFRRWYYDSILSTILAYRMDLEKFIVSIKPTVKRSRVKKEVNE